MIRHRTEDEVQRYDILKLVIALILVALLIAAAILGNRQSLTAPILVAPPAGAELDPGAVTLSGTGTPGSSINILANGAVIGTTVVADDGSWHYDTELNPGDYQFEFQAADASGNVVATSDSYALRVNAPVIADPTIDTPEGDVYASGYTLTGSAEPGYDVAIVVNGVEVGITTADANGDWAFPLELATGSNEIAVRTLDAGGAALNEFGTVSVETMEIAAPTLILPAAGLAAGALVLNGMGMPNTDVELLANGESLGIAPVGADGTWTLDTALDAGEYAFTMRGLDADGNLLAEADGGAGVAVADVVTDETSAETDAVVGNLEIPQFNLPSLTLPTFGIASGLLALNGIANPNTDVEILADGEVVGTTTADADGNWKYDLGLDPGVYDLSLRGVNEDGTATADSEPFGLNLGLQLPTFDPSTLSLSEPQGNLGDLELPSYKLPQDAFDWTGKAEPGGKVGIVVDGETVDTVDVDDAGNWSYPANFNPGEYLVKLQLLNADGELVGESKETAFNVVGQTFPSVVEQVEDAATGAVTLSGSAEPGATVEVSVDSEVVGTATADADGTWTLDTEMGEGAHFVQARSLDDDGNVALISLPKIYKVGEGSGSVLIADISGGASTTEPVTITGVADPGSEVALVVDGVPVGTTTADADGNFSYTGYFSGGAHTVTANSSSDESTTPFTVGTFDTPATTAEDGNGALRVLFFDPTRSDQTTAVLDQPGTSAASLPATELIVDASWSMTLGLTGDNRLTADNPDSRVAVARSALNEILEGAIPDGAPVALRAFGNIEGNLACRTDLMVPLSPLNREELRAVIDGIEPQFDANTAIADSLAQVANDLATDRSKIVVLLTDGEETCGGDPAAVIEDLRAQGIDVKVNVIGFAINNDALKSEFTRWADLGGGTYYDATNFDELVSALGSSLSVTYDVLDSEGNTVATGVVGGLPVELAPGQYTIVFSGQDEPAYENVVVTPGYQVRVLSN